MQGTSVPGTSAGPPRPAAAPAGIIEALGEHPLFAELPDDVLTGLAAASNRVELAAGDVLMSEDDAGDHAYLVLGGRFAVTVGGRLVGCPSRGDLIGEMALLVDAPRSATVTALRASVVIRIGGVAFTSLLASQPARQRLVSAQLVERLRRANRGPQLDATGRVIAVVTEAGRDTAQVSRDLGGALARAGRRSARLPVGAAGVSSAEVTILELGHDVVLLLDGLTRLGRAHNLAGPGSGRVLGGGVDAAALFPPKRLFAAARNVEDGGSLTILATASVETGSRTDEVLFEELAGTANLELHLRRDLAARRVTPAVDPLRSRTRREGEMMGEQEVAVLATLRAALDEHPAPEALELLVERVRSTQTNIELLTAVQRTGSLGRTPGRTAAK